MLEDDPSTAQPPWTVYIARCADGSLYTGIAKDVMARVAEHNRGVGAKYTRGRGPMELVYAEAAATRGEAQRREAEIKRLSAAAKRELVARLVGGYQQPAPHEAL